MKSQSKNTFLSPIFTWSLNHHYLSCCISKRSGQKVFQCLIKLHFATPHCFAWLHPTTRDSTVLPSGWAQSSSSPPATQWVFLSRWKVDGGSGPGDACARVSGEKTSCVVLQICVTSRLSTKINTRSNKIAVEAAAAAAVPPGRWLMIRQDVNLSAFCSIWRISGLGVFNLLGASQSSVYLTRCLILGS